MRHVFNQIKNADNDIAALFLRYHKNLRYAASTHQPTLNSTHVYDGAGRQYRGI